MTFFKEQVDSFYGEFQVGGVYLISRGSLKPANKKFSSIKNEYEISGSADTIVQAVRSEDPTIPTSRPAEYVAIDALQDRPSEDIVDVIGIVNNFSDLKEIKSKAGNALVKRDITLVDETMRSVDITLWAEKAETWAYPKHCVLSVKGARVGEYNGGRQLSSLRSTIFDPNPDTRRAVDLRAWFDNNPNLAFIPLSQNSGGGGAGGRVDEQKTFVEAEGLQARPNPYYWVNRGFVTRFRYADGATTYYDRCSGPDCRRKASESGGIWFCEVCKTQAPYSIPTYSLSFHGADHTQSIRLSALGDVGIPIMAGRDASTIKAARDNPVEYERLFEDATFRMFNFKIRSKPETYQEVEAMKHSVISATPVSWVADGQLVAANIKAMLSA